MPCMRCGEGKWEVVWDDGVMEYALCRACVRIMEGDTKFCSCPNYMGTTKGKCNACELTVKGS